jgi:hypothetical protein
VKKLMILAMLCIGPAMGQQPPPGPVWTLQQQREQDLGRRLFVFQMMLDCPNEVARDRINTLIDRTTATILREGPGGRGRGVVSGVEAAWSSMVGAVYLSRGLRAPLCRELANNFARAVTDMASE